MWDAHTVCVASGLLGETEIPPKAPHPCWIKGFSMRGGIDCGDLRDLLNYSKVAGAWKFSKRGSAPLQGKQSKRHAPGPRRSARLAGQG